MYVGQRYVAKVYLGNRYNLVYTNNSIDGRSPTGVFIDRSLTPWYKTDASFFEAGHQAMNIRWITCKRSIATSILRPSAGIVRGN